VANSEGGVQRARSRKRQALNERRLTKREVSQLLGAGAVRRRDLEAALSDARVGLRPMRCYELPENRVLWVFHEQESGLGGKGDIYTLDYSHRFVRWAHRVDADARAGRSTSVSHWYHFSQLRDALPGHADELVTQLRLAIVGSSSTLKMSYAGLDAASDYLESLGSERVEREWYDHLVAYVGEVIRVRTRGEWRIDRRQSPPYPYIAAPKHRAIMPINVVWSELAGLKPADLRTEAANEVRRARGF
jgi:hypothetical protein